MELFYAFQSDENTCRLDKDESHHCLKVMRHKPGEKIFVTDGKGKLFATIIKKTDRGQVELFIEKELKKVAPATYFIHIAISPTKASDRFEWFIEKAIELGVTEITPIKSQRTERNNIKTERLNKLMISAMKQSLRLWLPKLNPMITLKEFLSRNDDTYSQKLIAHCQQQNLLSILSLAKPMQHSVVLIGPEGDFTIEEVRMAESKKFIAVSLGDYRLRTETAGLTAVNTLNFINEYSP